MWPQRFILCHGPVAVLSHPRQGTVRTMKRDIFHRHNPSSSSSIVKSFSSTAVVFLSQQVQTPLHNRQYNHRAASLSSSSSSSDTVQSNHDTQYNDVRNDFRPDVSTTVHQQQQQQVENLKQNQRWKSRYNSNANRKRHFQWKTNITTTPKSFIRSEINSSKLQNKRLLCRQHLDPYQKYLPTSHWVHLDGTLSSTSLDEVVHSIENILYQELVHGQVVDLDAMWNPIQDETVPIIPWIHHDKHIKHEHYYDDDDNDNNSNGTPPPPPELRPNRVQAAHVVLSPFGRPTGWHLKLANASMVYALLARAASQRPIHIGWKMTLVKEYHPQRDDTVITSTNSVDGFLVDDTMVRFENCPTDMTEDDLRYLLSRYELARVGPTVIQWKRSTPDGKHQHMFVVRFHNASWARAAVREMQDMLLSRQRVVTASSQQQQRQQQIIQDMSTFGKRLRLMQYPNQRLVLD